MSIKRTILLVEDEALIAMNEAAMLKKHGCEVTTAYNAQNAVDTVREKDIDLVLMDIDLGRGKMSGTEAAEIILRDRDIPIVFCTSHSEKEYVAKVKAITNYGYVLKNSGEFVLIESINMAFKLFEAHQDLKQENEKRKKIEEYLREEQAELSAIYKHTPVLMIIVDKERRVRKANAFATEFAGAPAEDLIGKRGGEALRCMHHLDDPRGCGFGPYCEECKVRRTVTATFERGKSFKKLESTLPFSIQGKEKAITFLLSTSYLEIKGEPFVIVSIEDITERKKLEEKLRESGEKFRLLFNYSNDAIFVHEMGEDNLPSKNIEVNKRAARLLGYSREELLNMSAKDVTPEEHASTLYLHAQELMEKKHLTFETENIRSDGAVIPIEVSAYLYNEGNKKFVVSNVRDISNRKQAEKALQESGEKFRSVFSASPDAMVLANRETGIIIEANQAAVELFETPLRELIGMHQKELHPPEEQAIAKNTFKYKPDKAEEKAPPVEIEVQNRKHMKKFAEVRGRIVIINDEEYVLGNFRDITERKEQERTLKESEESLRITLKSIGDAVISTDVHGTVLQMNPAAERICGWRKEAARGRKLEEVFNIVNAETRKRADNPVDKVIQTGEIAGLANHTMLISRDGNEYQIADSAAPIRDDDGNINGVVLVFRDVTEKYEKEKQLKVSEFLLAESQRIAHLGSWTLDLINNSLYWSDEVYRIFGLGPQEFGATYEAFLEAVHPEDRNAVHRAYTSSLNEGKEGYEIDHRIVHHKTGEIRFVKERCYHTRDENGNIVASIGMIHDITEQKQVEEKLRVNKERYKKAQAVARVGSWEYHIETDTFWGSDEGKRIYGFDADLVEFTAEEVMKCVIEKERVNQAMADLIEKNTSYDIEFDIIPRNSAEIKTIHSVAELERDEHGKPVNVMGILQDITERKKMEEDLKTGKKFFTSIIENIPNMVFLKEAKNFTFYLVNKAAEETIGLKREDLIGKSDYDVFPKHEADFFREKDLEVITSGKEVVIQEEELAASDQIRYVYTKKVPIFNEEGNPQYLLGITEDITELKKALEEKDFLMKELNHRVKNNLMMITSLISLKNASLGEAVDLTDVKNQIDAIRIVHEKLYTAENVTQINFGEYAEDLLATIFSSFTDRPVQVDTEIQQGTLTAKTAVPLGLIVNELATNAIKHGFASGGEARFAVAFIRDTRQQHYILTVSNNGSPFPEDVEVTGPDTLGLQLISALVSQLNGTIELQRKPHPVFTITFPMEAE